jgi:asparagine synthase (glutamine-hydrolysing)
MCGIAGVIANRALEPCHRERLARMSQSMVHRGPDGEGSFDGPQVALASRRLSIIDPTKGWQPLYDETRNLALIANGEIYNYLELRKELAARGHVFNTDGDCETILHLYQEFGTSCVDHLRGMFAFALWDESRKTLLLARDRMGEKPLYLYEHGGVLYFASELRSLIGHAMTGFELDPSAIDHYFHFQFVPEPMTPIRGVRKLPAGHLMSVQLQPWKVEETCYWRAEDAPALDGDPVERIRAELETISRIVIRSDVPVGIALSGGIDSSAIAALAGPKYPGTMHAFCAGYSGRPHSDERAEAKALADHLNMPFHEIEIQTPDVIRLFPDLIHWQDDPVADLAGFGYWAVAHRAREQGVPVLLQGQGGDELFWGYPWLAEAVRQSIRKSGTQSSQTSRFRDYLAMYWPPSYPRRAPIDWILSWAGLRTSIDQYRRDRNSSPDRMVFYDLNDTYRIGADYAARIYSKAFRESIGESSPSDVFTMPRPWSRIDIAVTRLICETFLRANGIARGDRLSMANSVELRLPLVDYRLVETVIGLRKAQSDVELPPKAWLKAAVDDLVPEWVQKRPKRGFQPPLRAWHRALFTAYGHQLENGALVQLGILDPRAARALARGRYPLRECEPFSLTALVLEVWCRGMHPRFAD